MALFWAGFVFLIIGGKLGSWIGRSEKDRRISSLLDENADLRKNLFRAEVTVTENELPNALKKVVTDRVTFVFQEIRVSVFYPNGNIQLFGREGYFLSMEDGATTLRELADKIEEAETVFSRRPDHEQA